MLVVSSFALAAVSFSSATLFAQDKKEEKKDPPRIVMAVPLAVSPGEKIKLTLRGVGLDSAKAVQLGDGESKLEATIKSKGKTKVPDKYDAKAVGDTQIEIEFTLPSQTPTGKVTIVAITSDGETKAYDLRVIAADDMIDEKEPNDGFKQGQVVKIGLTIRGHITQSNEVDVYQFNAKAGQKITCESLASRLGSALDPLLTLYDANSNFVSMQDDADKSRDAILSFTAPTDGTYYLVIQDALDRGEPTHAYLLQVRVDE